MRGASLLSRLLSDHSPTALQHLPHIPRTPPTPHRRMPHHPHLTPPSQPLHQPRVPRLPEPRPLKDHHLRPIHPDLVHQEPPLDLRIQVTAILASRSAIPAYRGPLVEVRQSDKRQGIGLPPRFRIPAQHLLTAQFAVCDLAPAVLRR